ncbi:MAG: hypothetical protein PVF15_02345 [Candidatus Bathyarchaeota archaeon]|jgi:hypothetical protein
MELISRRLFDVGYGIEALIQDEETGFGDYLGAITLVGLEIPIANLHSAHRIIP